MFLRNILLPSSGSKSKPNKEEASSLCLVSDREDMRSMYFRNIGKLLGFETLGSVVIKNSPYLLGYNTVHFVESQLTLRRNMSPPYSGSKNKPSKKQGATWFMLVGRLNFNGLRGVLTQKKKPIGKFTSDDTAWHSKIYYPSLNFMIFWSLKTWQNARISYWPLPTVSGLRSSGWLRSIRGGETA
jgi:hypothetical protein